MRKKTEEATSVVYHSTVAGQAISFKTANGEARRCGNTVVVPAALAPAFEKAFSKQISSGRLVRQETGFLTVKAEAAQAIQAQPSARVAVEDLAAASAEAVVPEEKKPEDEASKETHIGRGRRGMLASVSDEGGS